MEIVEAGLIKKKPAYGWVKWLIVLVLIASLVGLGLYLRVQTKYNRAIVSLDQIPANFTTAMVFGAGLKARGQPSDILEDRVLTAIQAYQEGKIGQILMSADNSQANHNEVQAMENLALEQGLPLEAIIHDHAGVSTFESCRRAKQELDLNKIVLVTQKYHLKRALYICNELGLEAIGLDASKRRYQKQLQFSWREIPACIFAWVELRLYNR
jgi:vancomycin permeability regulator SanA